MEIHSSAAVEVFECLDAESLAIVACTIELDSVVRWAPETNRTVKSVEAFRRSSAYGIYLGRLYKNIRTLPTNQCESRWADRNLRKKRLHLTRVAVRFEQCQLMSLINEETNLKTLFCLCKLLVKPFQPR